MSRGRLFAVVNGGMLLLFCAATLGPFLQMVALSFNEPVDTVRGGLFLLPRKPTLDNFAALLSIANLGWSIGNSVLRTVLGATSGLVACSLLAYALSRKGFQARRPVAVLLTGTLVVSGGVLPTFLLMRDLHLLNTFIVYLLPGMVGAFSVFLLWSFMAGLPPDLSESAFLDGASEWTVYGRIVLPLCLPVVATVGLILAVGHWNSWFDNYLYNGSSPELSTLQFELMKVLQGPVPGPVGAVAPDSLRMAALVLTTVPIVVIYPFLQRYFIPGMGGGQAVRNWVV